MVEKIGPEDEETTLCGLFATLSHPLTLHIVELLSIAPRTARELKEHFDLRPQAIKRAMETLTQRGLAKSEDGRIYRLDDTAFRLMMKWSTGKLKLGHKRARQSLPPP